tara:strand:+ start:10342 stop:11193 length:852 start_codon:yes stop_codon:yes gene_type:complete
MLSKYSYIIGLEPSKGARSPVLWNKAYKTLGIDCSMLPIDIPDLPSLRSTFQNLVSDESCLGGCIAFPYKEHFLQLIGLSNVDVDASSIGAINCFYRNANGTFSGLNTDYIAFRKHFLSSCSELLKSSVSEISVVGFGGVGKAVLQALKNISKDFDFRINLVTTKHDLCVGSDINIVNYNDRFAAYSASQIIINCTTLGCNNLSSKSIFNESQLGSLSKCLCFYDLIYTPLQTLNMSLALTASSSMIIYNGLSVNLFQAVEAFQVVNSISYSDYHLVLSSMQN